MSVPLTASYNHHHGATIAGKHAELEIGTAAQAGALNLGYGHAGGQVVITHDLRDSDMDVEEGAAMPPGWAPASCILHEGNGGEFRKA